eukprot:tig00000882_g5269.t1
MRAFRVASGSLGAASRVHVGRDTRTLVAVAAVAAARPALQVPASAAPAASYATAIAPKPRKHIERSSGTDKQEGLGERELQAIREEVQLEIARARASAEHEPQERPALDDGLVPDYIPWAPTPPRGVSRETVTAESGGNRWRREATKTQKAAARVLRTMSRPTKEQLEEQESGRAADDDVDEEDDAPASPAVSGNEKEAPGPDRAKRRYYGYESCMRAVRAALASVHESVRPKIVAWCAFELAEAGLESRGEDLVRMTRQLQFRSASPTTYPLLRRVIDAGSTDWQRIFGEVYLDSRAPGETEPPRDMRELLAKACAMEGDFERADDAVEGPRSLARALLDAAGQLAVLAVTGRGGEGREETVVECLRQFARVRMTASERRAVADEWARPFFASFPRSSSSSAAAALLLRSARAAPTFGEACWAAAAARAWGAPCADALAEDLEPLWSARQRRPDAPAAAPLAAALLRCPDASPALRAEARAAFRAALRGPTSARLAAAALRDYAVGAPPEELAELFEAARAACGPDADAAATAAALAPLAREWSEALLSDCGLGPAEREAALRAGRALCSGHGAAAAKSQPLESDPFGQALWACKKSAVGDADDWLQLAAARAAAAALQGTPEQAARAAGEVRGVLELATLVARASRDPAVYLRVSAMYAAAADLPPALRLGRWAAGRCAALLAPVSGVQETLRRLAALEGAPPKPAAEEEQAEGEARARRRGGGGGGGARGEGQEAAPSSAPQRRRPERGRPPPRWPRSPARRRRTWPAWSAPTRSDPPPPARPLPRAPLTRARPPQALEVLRWARARGYRAPSSAAGVLARAFAAEGHIEQAVRARALCA